MKNWLFIKYGLFHLFYQITLKCILGNQFPKVSIFVFLYKILTSTTFNENEKINKNKMIIDSLTLIRINFIIQSNLVSNKWINRV